MRSVSIIGVGRTKFGEHWSQSFREMVTEASMKAIESAGYGIAGTTQGKESGTKKMQIHLPSIHLDEGVLELIAKGVI